MLKSGKLNVVAALAVGLAPLALCSCAGPKAVHGIPNFAEIEPGLWRGGQPNAEGWRHLKSLGVHRVVKLNTGGAESDGLASSNGMRVVYLPITFANQTFGKPEPGQLAAATAAMEPNGTFVHCQHGQDRTGLVVGAYRVRVNRWTKDAAYREMASHGFHPLLRGLYWAWQEDVH